MSRSILSDSFSNSMGSVAIVTLFLFLTCFVAGFAAVTAVGFRVVEVVEEETMYEARTVVEVAADTPGGTGARGEGIGGPSQENIGMEGVIAADDEGTNTEAEVFKTDAAGATWE